MWQLITLLGVKTAQAISRATESAEQRREREASERRWRAGCLTAVGILGAWMLWGYLRGDQNGSGDQSHIPSAVLANVPAQQQQLMDMLRGAHDEAQSALKLPNAMATNMRLEDIKRRVTASLGPSGLAAPQDWIGQVYITEAQIRIRAYCSTDLAITFVCPVENLVDKSQIAVLADGNWVSFSGKASTQGINGTGLLRDASSSEGNAGEIVVNPISITKLRKAD